MAQSTKAERKRRQAEALQVLSDGYGTTEAASLLSDRWGTSRKTALRAINAANVELLNDLNEIDKHHLLARLLNQLEQSIRGSMKQKNYGAAVSGIRLMNEMIISPNKR